MKKRILCVMLTLIMLVSLIPAGAISASAASLSISEPAITVLKKMTTFHDECYKMTHTQEWRNGYGTVCTKKGDHSTHSITEKKADEALRENLAKIDKRVSEFASNTGLSLKQNQHDALVVFSYDVGTAWMSGNGVVKTALRNGAGTNELLSAMASVDNDMSRRKIEVNMYVNGVYSNVIPNNYDVVTYDANGGTMPQGETYEMHFDKTQTVAHVPTPILRDSIFMGWYLDPNDDGVYVPSYNLNDKCAGKTLYALWQPKDLAPADAELWNNDVSYDLSRSQLASADVYNLPDVKTGSAWTKLDKDEKTVHVVGEYIGADGTKWAELGSARFVIVKAGSNGTGSSNNGGTEIDVTVTVTNSFVKSRKNATVFSAQNGSYNQGAKLRIINTASADGFLWGQIAKSETDNTPIGWVALRYTNWDSVQGEDKGSSNNTNAIARATITFGGYVNMRSGAGTDNKIVGALANNDTVDIYEIKIVNGHQWGRTTGGWFCLTYADLTMLNGNKIENISNEGALNYVFPASLTYAVTPRVSPSDYADDVQSTYEYKDKDKNVHTVNILPEAGESINVYNLAIRNGETWAKISWRVDLDENGADDTTKYGWVKVNKNTDLDEGYGADVHLAVSTTPVELYPVKFTVVADELTVRTAPNSGAAPVNKNVKISKGVEIQVSAIQLVGENIWGYLDNEHVYYPTDGANSDTKAFDGWVNLATKYVSRSELPTIPGDSTLTPTGKIGTIVGTDKVNVRITGSTSGKIIGKLSRGTSANILEVSKNGDWYNLDVDVDKNPKTGTWVNKQYVEVSDGTIGGSNGNSGSNKPAPVTTGTGVVANTYSGVNVRSGAGQSYAALGKLLPGTIVKISEMKQVGAAKWAHVEQGWVCMDYITMLSEETTYPDGDPNKGDLVGSYDEVETTKTSAVYTGVFAGEERISIYAEPVHGVEDMSKERISSSVVRYANPGDQVTIYELLSVTEKVTNGSDDVDGDGHGSGSKVTRTSYWARTNDGYIFNPEKFIQLDALDEKVHTLTGAETLNVRTAPGNGDKIGKLKQGDQVEVTRLQIVNDKVWGYIEFEGKNSSANGWIRLDYMHDGAVYVAEKPSEPTTPPSNGPVIGAGGDNGGFVNNGGGYRYTGRVVNTNQVNVRATASTTAKVTTTLKSGAALVIYETTVAENMAWGRCDAGWVYLYYVDLVPATSDGAIDARVVKNNVPGIIYTDSNCSGTAGTYSAMSVIDIYEVVGSMARTNLGWVNTNDLL